MLKSGCKSEQSGSEHNILLRKYWCCCLLGKRGGGTKKLNKIKKTDFSCLRILLFGYFCCVCVVFLCLCLFLFFPFFGGWGFLRQGRGEECNGGVELFIFC